MQISRTLFLIVFFCHPLAVALDYVPGEVIVKMKSTTSSGSQSPSRLLGKTQRTNKMSLKKSWKKFKLHQFKLKEGVSVEDAINDLHFDPDVEYAEPNYILRKQSVGIEGAPLSIDEVQAMNVQFSAAESFAQTSADINADEAWDILSPTSSKPIVAIIDSGIDYSHYVFQETGALWENPGEIPNNGIDDDGNGYIDDVYGWNFVNNNNDPMDDDNHGTHVAGITLGMTQDILRQSGDLAPAKIKLMALKFLDDQGSGSTSDAIEAIQYAANNGAKVLNNSWGGGYYSQALKDAITATHESGLAFIAAAGNSANDNDATPTYPANYSVANLVSVAATSSRDSLASFSNYGQQSVHIGSPGISIISTLPNGTFGYSSGTSMAAPFASGLAALLYREKSQITGYQVKGVLYDYSLPVETLSGKVSSGSRLDAYEAVYFVKSSDMSEYQPEEADRWLSSVGDAGTTAGASASGGCGMVQAFRNGSGGGSGKPPGSTLLTMLFALMAPLALIAVLRRQVKNKDQDTVESRRAHKRYQVDSKIAISVGEQKLVAQMKSISQGGVQIDTDALLQQGGVIRLSIATPEGETQVELQGQVVWCEQKKSYGVKFLESTQETLDQLGSLTQSLVEQKAKG